jgi:LL-diaminopimelate aminotransferase
MKINSHISSLPGSYLFQEIASRIKTFEQENPKADILRLGIGDVTRPLSPYVAEKFASAARDMATAEGFRGYPPGEGYHFLIDAINKNDYAARGIALQDSEIFISDGAKTDAAAIQELFDKDCRIAFTDPVYPVYVDSNAMAGRLGTFENGRWSNAVYLPSTAENGFVPPLPEEKVDVLYLCYPNNPTGTVLTKAQLKPFVDWARQNNALIIYDAAYKAFITDEDIPRSIYEIEGAKEVAIECCSFSKTAGFTGVRCAYTVVPHQVTGRDNSGKAVSLNALWKRRTGSKNNGVSYPVQVAAAAVYDEQGRKETEETIRYYLDNARVILDALKQGGLTVYGGVHAPYIWMKTPDNMKSWDFFDYLLRNAHVVGTPGAGFGPCGEGYFRLTAFGSRETARQASGRILNMLSK